MNTENPTDAQPATAQADPNAWKAQCFIDWHRADKHNPADKRLFALYHRDEAGTVWTYLPESRQWGKTDFPDRAAAALALEDAPQPPR